MHSVLSGGSAGEQLSMTAAITSLHAHACSPRPSKRGICGQTRQHFAATSCAHLGCRRVLLIVWRVRLAQHPDLQ